METWKVAPLTEETWPGFAAVIEDGRGAWGGCWCLGFHRKMEKGTTVDDHRREKFTRVVEGRTHAALVYDETRVVGWCQFGPTAELPLIKHRRECEASPGPVPDWRITCFFVDREYRRRGVARAALNGALAEISRFGGGVVESYPEDTEGRKVSSSFLYNAPWKLFASVGFEKIRRLGKDHWVVVKTVAG